MQDATQNPDRRRRLRDLVTDAFDMVFQTADLPNEVLLFGDDASAIHFSINGRAGRSLGAPRTAFNTRITRDDYHAFLMQP